MRGRFAVPCMTLLRCCFLVAAISILWLVPSQASATTPGPVAAYSFDEGSGETVEDVTGNGHTATIDGAEWTGQGRYGGALEFVGSEMTASRSRTPPNSASTKNSPSRPGCGPTRNPA